MSSRSRDGVAVASGLRVRSPVGTAARCASRDRPRPPRERLVVGTRSARCRAPGVRLNFGTSASTGSPNAASASRAGSEPVVEPIERPPPSPMPTQEAEQRTEDARAVAALEQRAVRRRRIAAVAAAGAVAGGRWFWPERAEAEQGVGTRRADRHRLRPVRVDESGLVGGTRRRELPGAGRRPSSTGSGSRRTASGWCRSQGGFGIWLSCARKPSAWLLRSSSCLLRSARGSGCSAGDVTIGEADARSAWRTSWTSAVASSAVVPTAVTSIVDGHPVRGGDDLLGELTAGARCVPSSLATRSGTSPVVTRIAIWSRLFTDDGTELRRGVVEDERVGRLVVGAALAPCCRLQDVVAAHRARLRRRCRRGSARQRRRSTRK